MGESGVSRSEGITCGSTCALLRDDIQWRVHGKWSVHGNSALKSGPVSVLLPFLEGPRTGPVPEGFRMQEPRTGTAKNRKKLVVTSALKSGPVSVLLPFLEGPRTGPVPEGFRMQEPRTGTTKNRKKPVVTGRNQSRNEYNKTRARSAKLGHML